MRSFQQLWHNWCPASRIFHPRQLGKRTENSSQNEWTGESERGNRQRCRVDTAEPLAVTAPHTLSPNSEVKTSILLIENEELVVCERCKQYCINKVTQAQLLCVNSLLHKFEVKDDRQGFAKQRIIRNTTNKNAVVKQDNSPRSCSNWWRLMAISLPNGKLIQPYAQRPWTFHPKLLQSNSISRNWEGKDVVE